MHVGTDFLKLPPVTGQYWSLFQCSVLGTGGTCVTKRNIHRQLNRWCKLGKMASGEISLDFSNLADLGYQFTGGNVPSLELEST